MVGNEKKQLLNRLPEKFDEILYPDVCGTIKLIRQVNKLLTLVASRHQAKVNAPYTHSALFHFLCICIVKGFEELYHILSAWDSQVQGDVFFKKVHCFPLPISTNEFYKHNSITIKCLFLLVCQANDWVKLFLSLKDKEEGYSKSNITPYIHMLVYHVPKFLCDEQGLKIFTGQGVEKTNDVVRAVYQRKINKLDSCKDTLMALKRRDVLVQYEKKPNSYSKHDDAYWTQQITEDRRKRQRLCKPL